MRFVYGWCVHSLFFFCHCRSITIIPCQQFQCDSVSERFRSNFVAFDSNDVRSMHILAGCFVQCNKQWRQYTKSLSIRPTFRVPFAHSHTHTDGRSKNIMNVSLRQLLFHVVIELFCCNFLEFHSIFPSYCCREKFRCIKINSIDSINDFVRACKMWYSKFSSWLIFLVFWCVCECECKFVCNVHDDGKAHNGKRKN